MRDKLYKLLREYGAPKEAANLLSALCTYILRRNSEWLKCDFEFKSHQSARIRKALADAKSQGKVLGKRRRTDIPMDTVSTMRQSGKSWRSISRELAIPVSTLCENFHDMSARNG